MNAIATVTVFEFILLSHLVVWSVWRPRISYPLRDIHQPDKAVIFVSVCILDLPAVMDCKRLRRFGNGLMADRRTLLLMLVPGGAVVGGFRALPSLFEGLPEFEPLDDPPGFRRVAGGSVSSGFNPFAGLSVGGSEETPARVSPDSLRANLRSHLFGTAARSEGVVPIASFADYYCPYCRVQTKRLSELGSERGSEVAIEWHELPLLGETSILAARAALAAKRQDAYVAFHESLLTSPFRANAEYLSLLSGRIGVDHARLIADMESESVSRELEVSAALSRLFAFVGTPAMVVGRTVIQGEISDRTLRRIISLEREEGWSSVC